MEQIIFKSFSCKSQRVLHFKRVLMHSTTDDSHFTVFISCFIVMFLQQVDPEQVKQKCLVYESVTLTAYLSQKDVPCPAGCWDDRLLTDKLAPFVWPPPRQFLPVAAAPHFPHDLFPQYLGSAHCNRGARCHWPGPSWKVESVCCPAVHSSHQQDLI